MEPWNHKMRVRDCHGQTILWSSDEWFHLVCWNHGTMEPVPDNLSGAEIVHLYAPDIFPDTWNHGTNYSMEPWNQP